MIDTKSVALPLIHELWRDHQHACPYVRHDERGCYCTSPRLPAIGGPYTPCGTASLQLWCLTEDNYTKCCLWSAEDAREERGQVMAGPWSKQKESVAYHEVGHRVQTSLVKASPTLLSIRRNEEGNWEGDVPHFPATGVSTPSKILVACAGPLAEIKYQIRLKYGSDAAFVPGRKGNSLLRHFGNPEQFERDCDPRIYVPVLVGKEKKTLEIEVEALSDDGLQARAWAKRDGLEIRSLLVQAWEHLKQPNVWRAVVDLAEAVLVRLGDKQKITIPARDAERIIKRALKQPTEVSQD